MSSTVKELQAPLSLEAVKDLKIGELASITGVFFSCRSKFHAKILRDKAPVPPDIIGINVTAPIDIRRAEFKPYTEIAIENASGRIQILSLGRPTQAEKAQEKKEETEN